MGLAKRLKCPLEGLAKRVTGLVLPLPVAAVPAAAVEAAAAAEAADWSLVQPPDVEFGFEQRELLHGR